MVYVFLNIKNYLNFLPATFSYFLLSFLLNASDEPAPGLGWYQRCRDERAAPHWGGSGCRWQKRWRELVSLAWAFIISGSKAGRGQGCGFSHSHWVLFWLSWLLLSDLKKGVASQVFVICSQGDTLLGLVCVCIPHPPTHRMHMHVSPEALSMLHFKSLWLESWLFPMTNHPITCRGNGVTVIGLDQWIFPRACSIQPGMDGVISESFPLLYYMHLIIRGVFCRIPCSQPPSSRHSVGTASLELVGTTCVYLTPWAVVSLLPHDGVGVCVLFCDCFTFLISSLSFYYSLDANRPALQFGSRHLATAHLMVLLQE